VGTVVAFGDPEGGPRDGVRSLVSLFDAIDRPGLSVEEMLRAVVELLPAAVVGAEGGARIVIGAIAVQTRAFAPTFRKRAALILMRSEAVGTVEVYRRDGGPAVAEAEETGGLVDAVAMCLGQALERWRAERERDESRERYRRLTDLLPDAVVVHEAGRVVDANPAAADLLAAIAAEDLIGRPFLDFVHPEFRDRMTARLARPTVGADHGRRIAIKMIRLDDAVIDVEMADGAAVIGGEVVRQAVICDVTREKREEALSQVAQLTPREYQVMRMVAAGETSKAIALRLGLSPKTVEVHRAGVMRKMGVKSLADLIRKKDMIGVP